MTESIPKKKRRWLKILAIIVALLFLVIALLPFYSGFFTSFIISPIQEMTGRQVSIGDFSISLLTSRLYIGEVKIKEQDKTTDFIHLQKVDIDFSILPLIGSKVRVPRCEIAGLTLNVNFDKSGRANFQSILERMSSGKSVPKKPKSKTKPQPLQLPDVKAHLIIADVNLSVKDEKNDKTFAVKNFALDCQVDGFDKIRYHSQTEGIDFSSHAGKKQTAGLLHEIRGELGLVAVDGQPAVTSKGQFSLANIYAKGFGDNDLDNSTVKLSHQLAMDAGKGTVDVQKVEFVSDYLQMEIVDFQMRNLQKLQALIEKLPQANTPQALADIVSQIDIKGWQGQFRLSCDLNRLRKDFADMIAQASHNAVTDFGGKFHMSAQLSGEKNGILKVSEKVSFDNFYVTGNLPQKPYRIALQQIAQNFDTTVNLQQINLDADFGFTVTALANKRKIDLIKMATKVESKELLSEFSLKKNNLLSINLSAIAQVFKDLLPPDVKVAGKIISKDQISGKLQQGLRYVGKTDIGVRVASQKIKKLPALRITSSRDVNIKFDQQHQLQKLAVRKFYLQSKGSKMLLFKASGGMDLSSSKPETVNISLYSQLKDLQPYIDVFAKGLSITGVLQHKTQISKKDNLVKVRGAGVLKSFSLAVEQSSKPPISLDKLSWSKEVNLYLQGNQPQRVEIVNIGIKHPALLVKINGNVREVMKPSPILQELKLEAIIYGQQLQTTMIKLLNMQDTALARDVKMQGRMQFKAAVNGSPDRELRVACTLNGNAFGLQWQPENQLLVNKTTSMPLYFETHVVMAKVGDAMRLTLNPMRLEIAQEKITSGSILLDEKQNLTAADGTSLVKLLDIAELKFDNFHSMLPIMKTADINGATLKLKVYDFGGSIAKKQLGGKLLMHLNIPKLSLVKLQKALPKSKTTAPPQAEEKMAPKADVPEQSQETSPLVGLDSQTREMLKNFLLDVDIRLGHVDIDAQNQARDLHAVIQFNKEQANNKLLFNTTGKMNGGDLSIKCTGDLDQEHPPFTFDYDINELPYSVNIMAPVQQAIAQKVPFPLGTKMDMGNTSDLKIAVSGGLNWQGLDPRAIKKSAVSPRSNIFKLPAGKFDLGFDVSKLFDAQAMQEELTKKLAPLKKSLGVATDQKSSLLKQIQPIQDKIETIDNSIKQIENKRQSALQTINKLKALPFLGPMRSKLDKAEQNLKSYDQKIADYKKQQGPLRTSLGKIQAQMQKVQDKIDAMDKKIAEEQKALQGKMGIANPFTFDFTSFKIELDVLNKDPWQGLGNLLNLRKHPTSKLQYIKFEFTPKNGIFPKIGGWSDFDGNFAFELTPAPELLNKAPALAKSLSAGVVWTPKGISLKR